MNHAKIWSLNAAQVMFSQVKKGGGICFFWLVTFLFFLTESNAELGHWHDASTIKYKNISHRHGRIDSSGTGKAAVCFFFFLPLAICCTCVQENVGNWPLFKLDSEWTCECKWMLSCYLLKQTCMLLFTGISSNAIFVFCQCLFSMCFFSLVIYMIMLFCLFENCI